MKRILQIIKLRKFKTELNESFLKGCYEGEHFLCWYKDGSCKEIFSKYDLIRELEKDHIKPIKYIFDMTDRIIIDRDIKINIEEVDKNV